MTAVWTGELEVDGHRATLTLAPGGWLTAETPLVGDAATLLRAQERILSPAKIATGPSLRAELPALGAHESTVAALQAALRRGLAGLEGRRLRDAKNHERASGADAAARALLAAYSPATPGWVWARDGAGWCCTVEAGRLTQRLLVRVGRCVRFGADLGQLRDLRPESCRALVHFLLALNARLRLARAALGASGVSLEVVLPASDLDQRMIDRALGALVVGAAVAKRECAALAEPALAAQYCAFHTSTLAEDGR